tara:strand:- start:7416 stop:7715 length:300 start_codon:yes stop_codon:yes gene_type:complete
MKTISSEEFKKAINSNAKVIVQFSADWCGPCKTLSPVLDSFAETKNDLSVYKVNIDDNRDLVTEFKIRSIPKIVLFKNGMQTNESIGLITKEKLNEFIA